MNEPTDDNTASMTRDEALAWAAGELMAPPADDREEAVLAADVAGMMLATAEADDHRPPPHVLAAVPLGEVVRLLHAALTVGGSIVRQHPDAGEFLSELITGLRDEGA